MAYPFGERPNAQAENDASNAIAYANTTTGECFYGTPESAVADLKRDPRSITRRGLGEFATCVKDWNLEDVIRHLLEKNPVGEEDVNG